MIDENDCKYQGFVEGDFVGFELDIDRGAIPVRRLDCRYVGKASEVDAPLTEEYEAFSCPHCGRDL